MAPDKQAQFGSRTALLMIGAAVYVSTVEGRPITAKKLAGFVGQPRPTVVRRLRVLNRLGVLERTGRGWRTSAKRMEQLARSDTRAMARTVRIAADRLKR
ncbi:hypothetical protein [Bradyrhizobium sp. USDA 4545]|uniref:hypothetical protein n=1 Tax=Bradyrhizobium sp. USDA 4545 TaxID=2817705 RepID=UPI0020A5CC58|nr:hypothetical protein [Bradyrhizobium sp. USDA 4545]